MPESAKEEFRFEISSVVSFIDKNRGVSVHGWVTSGKITPGTLVEILREDSPIRANVVEMMMWGKILEVAGKGEELGIELQGVDEQLSKKNVKKGMILCMPTGTKDTVPDCSESNQPAPESMDTGFKFEIEDVFSMKGKEAVAVGWVTAGEITAGVLVTIEVGDTLIQAKVVELGIYGKTQQKAIKGEVIGITLKGVDAPLTRDVLKRDMVIRCSM